MTPTSPVTLRNNSRGFTIVELMIATMVFSVLILAITIGVINFTRSYYKGANVAKTQDTARSIMDSVSQSLQFGKSDFTEVVTTTDAQLNYFCAGGYRYLFTKGVKYPPATQVPSTTNAGLYVMQASGLCDIGTIPAGPLGTAGTELLSDNMRITQLDVNPQGNNLYAVAITVGSGDNDLFCNASTPSTCNPGAATLTDAALADAGPDLKCKSSSGSQFCAVSSLSTVVRKRT